VKPMRGRTLSRADLVEALRREIGFSKSEAKSFVNAALDEIASALNRGEPAKATNFGSFQVRQRKARNGRNPRTGNDQKIPARRNVVFTASKALKEKVADREALNRSGRA
jgi:integration host factor subunit alpha